MKIQGIPSNIQKPGFYGVYNTLGASGLAAFAQKLLLPGQMLSGGTQAALTPAQVFSPAEAAVLFGAGSWAHRMVIKAMMQAPGIAPWVVGIADAAASVAATGSIAMTGTAATESGTVPFSVGDDRLELGVQLGDTPTVLAARLAALLTGRTELPISSSATTGTVTATAKNKGTLGNGIVLKCLGSVGGITIAVTAMSGGATDPDLQGALDAITPARFHVLAFPAADASSLAKLKTYLELVSSPLEQRPGRGFTAVTGAAKAVAAQVTIANGVNEERTHISYFPGSWTHPVEIAAALAGVVAAKDNPSTPFNGAVLAGVHTPEISLRLTRTEQEVLLAGGVTPLEVDVSGNASVVKLVTTRTTTNGASDLVLLSTNPIAILDYLRDLVKGLRDSKYSDAKATDSVLSAFRADVLEIAHKLEAPGLEILQHVDDYKHLLTMGRDTVSGRASLQIPVPWVAGLDQVFASFNLINVI